MDPLDLKLWYQEGTSNIAGSILKAWSYIHYTPYQDKPEELLGLMLWGNSLIRRRNKPIFDSSLVNSNIDTILDIYDVNKHDFLTYTELCDVFGTVIELLLYYGITTSIPKVWKAILRHYDIEGPLDEPTPCQKLLGQKCCSKYIYWKLIEKTFALSLGAKYIWEKE